ncbi:MAG: hypothetical protein ABIQ58_02715 [Candidatus Limnocylindrales bacterium]
MSTDGSSQPDDERDLDRDDSTTEPPVAPPTAPTALARLRATAEAATDPLVESVSAAIGAAIDSLRDVPLARARRIRRLGRQPLPSLPDLFPEARRARPVEIGLRTIEVDDVRGTAVGGGDQRGADFLPLRPFRGRNWSARWQRLRRAHDALRDLPPIDVVKYDGGYWVIDGHNRVGLALYAGQVGIDASVVELVPPGGRRTEPIGSLAAEVETSRLVRGRVDAEAATSEADQAPADDDRAG